MAEEKPAVPAGMWALVADEIRSDGGSYRVQLLGAIDGIPLAQVSCWAASSEKAISFLRAAADALAQRHGKILLPGNSRN